MALSASFEGRAMTSARTLLVALFGFLLECSRSCAYITRIDHGRLLQTMKQKEAPVILAPPQEPVHKFFGAAVSMDASGSRLVVGASALMQTDNDLNYLPLAYVYEKIGKKWTVVKTLTPPNSTANAGLDLEMLRPVRVSMSGSGKAILVSYFFEKNPYGYDNVLESIVSLYRRDKKGRWTFEKKFLPPKLFNGGSFGSGVAIDYSGNTVLILARQAKVYNHTRGAGFIFARKNGRWKFIKRLKDINATDFGASGALDASGTTAVLSGTYEAPENRKSREEVVIFRLIDGKWKRTKSLTPPQKKDARAYSLQVAIDGPGKTVAAIDTNTGTCHIYDKKKRWTLFDTIIIPSANLTLPIDFENLLLTGRRTLQSVALSESGSRLALGVIDTCEDCGFSGIVRVYRRGTNRWKLEYEVSSPGRDVTMDTFGFAVSINSRYLAVGEPFELDYLGGSGQVAVFEDSS